MLRYDNGDSLGVTGTHPLYSLDRQQFIPVSELHIGEKLLSKSGIVTLIEKIYDPIPQEVYNLEVGQWHNFLVGRSGVVAHNTGCLAQEIDKILIDLQNQAHFDLQGTGIYKTVDGITGVGGHHPLMKVAFEGDANYSLKKAFSISIDKLDDVWKQNNIGTIENLHAKISGSQNSLYTAFAKNRAIGEILTIDKMAEIEIKAMTNNGIPKDIATGWVVKALEDIKAQGVLEIKNIPWNAKNIPKP